MKQILFFYRYLIHFFRAKNSRGHGVQSPYLFSFVQNVFYEKNSFYTFEKIEKLRNELKIDSQTIRIKDYGTGNKTEEKISAIAKKSLKRKKWAQILYRIVNFSKAKNILELGTSLGISTLYLAMPNSKAKCITMEGAPEIAQIAQRNFNKFGCNNIEIVIGSIDENINSALQNFEKIDIVFFDANHKKEPTLSYFEKCLPYAANETIFIFDDIHWSTDMEEAWSAIKKNNKVQVTIDLFEMGIVFFNKNLMRKNYIMHI